MTIRVILADDHPPTRQGVRAALESAPDIALRKLGVASRLAVAAWVHDHIPAELWDDEAQVP